MTATQRGPLKQKAQVRTSTIRDSVYKIDVSAMRSFDLWGNHVTDEPYQDTKTNDASPGFGNQCTIRVDVTLHKVGIGMKSFTPASVSVKPNRQSRHILMESRCTAVPADQVGSRLNKYPFCGLRETEDITGGGWESKVKERTNIIVFDSYWPRSNDSAGDANGGHIDLWNGSRLIIGGPVNSIAIISRMFGMNSLFPRSLSGFSDLGDSKKTLSWEVRWSA